MPHTVLKKNFTFFKNYFYFVANKTWSKAHFLKTSALVFHASNRQCGHNIQLQIHGQCVWLWHWTREASSHTLFHFLRKTIVISLPLSSFNSLWLRVLPLNTALIKWKGIASETLKEGHKKQKIKMMNFLQRQWFRWGRWGQKWQLQIGSLPCPPLTLSKEVQLPQRQELMRRYLEKPCLCCKKDALTFQGFTLGPLWAQWWQTAPERLQGETLVKARGTASPANCPPALGTSVFSTAVSPGI